MIDELLRIYEESRLNRGQPESTFNPTLIFNYHLRPGKTCWPRSATTR